MLTDEQLKAMRERCEAATDGPWEHDIGRLIEGAPAFGFAICAPGKTPHVAGAGVASPNHATVTPGISTGFESQEVEANAEFIAAARTDIPLLLDEVERLKDELEESERFLRESTVG